MRELEAAALAAGASQVQRCLSPQPGCHVSPSSQGLHPGFSSLHPLTRSSCPHAPDTPRGTLPSGPRDSFFVPGLLPGPWSPHQTPGPLLSGDSQPGDARAPDHSLPTPFIHLNSKGWCRKTASIKEAFATSAFKRPGRFAFRYSWPRLLMKSPPLFLSTVPPLSPWLGLSHQPLCPMGEPSVLGLALTWLLCSCLAVLNLSGSQTPSGN